MLVIFNGEKKDLNHTIANKLIKMGLAEAVKEKKTTGRKKIVKDE